MTVVGIFPYFTKVDNFCDFTFAFLPQAVLLKWSTCQKDCPSEKGSILKGTPGGNLFSFAPFQKGGNSNVDRFASLIVYSSLDSLSTLREYIHTNSSLVNCKVW